MSENSQKFMEQINEMNTLNSGLMPKKEIVQIAANFFCAVPGYALHLHCTALSRQQTERKHQVNLAENRSEESSVLTRLPICKHVKIPS